MNAKKYQLGIIGLGHMGLALANGCINGGLLTNKDIAVLAHSPKTITRCENAGFFMANTTEELVQSSHVLLLAVPPKNLDETLEELGPLLQERSCECPDTPAGKCTGNAAPTGELANKAVFQPSILSVVAGRSIKSIQDKLCAAASSTNTAAAATNLSPAASNAGAATNTNTAATSANPAASSSTASTSTQNTTPAQIPVAHALPNATLQVGLGACAIAFSKEFNQQEADFVKQIFSCAGVVYELPEELINASVAAHGSTPAYVYYFANCMIEHLKTCGFEEKCARDLLVQTIAGSAKLMQESPDKSIDLFIDEIATEGGTTAAAIDVLKNSSFANDLAKANNACIKRCNELAK